MPTRHACVCITCMYSTVDAESVSVVCGRFGSVFVFNLNQDDLETCDFDPGSFLRFLNDQHPYLR
jgi:hypothetical protein